jgi:hypothetical protein
MMAKAPFQDPDLHTPAHDAIMMWLEENAEAVFTDQFNIRQSYQKERIAVAAAMQDTDLPVHVMDGCAEMLKSWEPVVDISTQWEVPTRFSGGTRYIDMVISGTWRYLHAEQDLVEINSPYLSNDLQRDEWKRKVISEGYEVFETDSCWLKAARNRFAVVGVTDARVIACEIKPIIRSVGELIRQLRQYEGHRVQFEVTRDRRLWWSDIRAQVAVVSPDDRFRAIIEKQGFIFIKAPQPEYGPQGGLF